MATSFRHPSLPPGLRCLARPPRGPGAGALPVLVSPRTRQRWPARTRCPPPLSRNPNAGGRGRGARRNQRAPQRRAKPATVPRCTLALCAPGRAGPTSRRFRGSVPKVTFEEKNKQGQTRPNKTKQDQTRPKQDQTTRNRNVQEKSKQGQTRPNKTKTRLCKRHAPGKPHWEPRGRITKRDQTMLEQCLRAFGLLFVNPSATCLAIKRPARGPWDSAPALPSQPRRGSRLCGRGRQRRAAVGRARRAVWSCRGREHSGRILECNQTLCGELLPCLRLLLEDSRWSGARVNWRARPLARSKPVKVESPRGRGRAAGRDEVLSFTSDQREPRARADAILPMPRLLIGRSLLECRRAQSHAKWSNGHAATHGHSSRLPRMLRTRFVIE